MSMEPGFMGRFTQDRDAKKSLRQLDKAAVSVITTHLKPYWKTLLFSVLLMAVVASVNAAAPYLIRIAIDDHILPGDYAGLLAILAAYVGLYLVYWIASFWGRYLSSKVGQSVIADVREQMFSHVMRLSQQFYERQPIGNLMSRLVNDVNSISELISYGLTGVVSDIVTLLAIFAAMVYMNPTLALVAFLVIPMILFGTNAIGRMMRSASREVRQKLAGLSAGVEENVAGARAVAPWEERNRVSSGLRR